METIIILLHNNTNGYKQPLKNFSVMVCFISAEESKYEAKVSTGTPTDVDFQIRHSNLKSQDGCSTHQKCETCGFLEFRTKQRVLALTMGNKSDCSSKV